MVPICWTKMTFRQVMKAVIWSMGKMVKLKMIWMNTTLKLIWWISSFTTCRPVKDNNRMEIGDNNKMWWVLPNIIFIWGGELINDNNNNNTNNIKMQQLPNSSNMQASLSRGGIKQQVYRKNKPEIQLPHPKMASNITSTMVSRYL